MMFPLNIKSTIWLYMLQLQFFVSLLLSFQQTGGILVVIDIVDKVHQ